MKVEETIIKEKLSLAFQNQKNKNLRIAEKLYLEILDINPNHYETICNLGLMFASSKKFESASKMFLKALDINPQSASLNNNLGNIYFEIGNKEKALNFFKKAVQIDNDFIDAHFNLSLLLRNIGYFDEALDHLNIIIKLNPRDIRAHINSAMILQTKGEYKRSIQSFENALKIEPNNHTTVNLFVELIKSLKLANVKEDNFKYIKDIFLFLLKKNNINHNDIFNNAKLVLFFREEQSNIEKLIINKLPLLNNQIIKEKLKDEYFYLILQKCLIRDNFLEKLLVELRKEILLLLIKSKKKDLNNFINFIISYSQQSFLNEYIYFQTKDETNYILTLEKKILKQEKIEELDIAVLASYKPLNKYPELNKKLLNYISQNNLFNEMVKTQIIDPLKEEELKKTFRSIKKISDKTSAKVRSQYEENPYPRWKYAKANTPYNFSNKIKNEIFPNLVNLSNNFINPAVLVAGCGTGSHLANTIYYKGADITAIDLSLSSLSYAKRKIQEIGYTKIEYLHGDILDLKNIDKKFDVIECVGVLHHMEDPLKGLKILVNLLKKNGVLKLGLYSKLARLDVEKVRDFFKKEKLKNSVDDIRRLREIIKNKNNDILFKKITLNYDFFSSSNFRDLVFHVKEHRYSILNLYEILKDFNLEFLGFTNPYIKKKYSVNFPEDEKCIDLHNWNKFEKKYTDSFTDMYQFWVRKN